MVNIGSFFQSKFWRDWADRFMDNHDKYITPNDPLVEEEANKVDMLGCCGNHDVPVSIWVHIYETVDYKLSKEWKTPRQTLKDGIGDCEDVDFLALSMMGNMGVKKAFLVIGNIKTPYGDGAHTWVEHNGRVIDPTGGPEDVKKATYEEKERFKIKFE